MKEVRELGQEYKQKKQLLQDARNEIETLSETLQSLHEQQNQLRNQLLQVEQERGLVGYFSRKSTVAKDGSRSNGAAVTDDQTSWREDSDDDGGGEDEATESELQERVGQLNEQIDAHKRRLTDLVQQVKPLRREQSELKRKHDEQRSAYDAVAAGLEMRLNELQTTNQAMARQTRQSESDLFRLDCETQLLHAKLRWFRLQPTSLDNARSLM
jgi:predicted  nucleic acid-binding Zn-ribbon protein